MGQRDIFYNAMCIDEHLDDMQKRSLQMVPQYVRKGLMNLQPHFTCTTPVYSSDLTLARLWRRFSSQGY
jgi:hypothetical protein